MAKKFKFEIVTPERVFYSDDIEMLTFNTKEGEIGILADHSPMLIANIVCMLKIKKDENEEIASFTIIHSSGKPERGYSGPNYTTIPI